MTSTRIADENVSGVEAQPLRSWRAGVLGSWFGGSRIGSLLFLALCTIYFGLPIYWVIVAATKSTTDLYGTFGLWFAHDFQLAQNLVGTFNYGDHIFARWVLNSVIYSGAGALGATLLSAACGYALAKYRFRGRELLFSIALAGVMLPQSVITLPLYLLLSRMGLVNTYWAMILPSLVSPFGVYLARIYSAAGVPDDLLEAARVDGAGELRIFFTMGLRLMTPALTTVFLFQAIAVWNNYFLALVVLSKQSLYSVVLGLAVWNSQAISQSPELYPFVVTGAFLSVVILGAVIVVVQRYWRGGLTAGSSR